MKHKIGYAGLSLASLFGATSEANIVTPWIGTADYKQATGAQGDEDVVGPFSGYDFSNGGVVLLTPAAVAVAGQYTPGDTYRGYYQTYVTNHIDHKGAPVASPNLNDNGAGAGYELTFMADFTQQVISVDSFGNANFAITGGTASLFFDTSPDYNFLSDSGFGGNSLISGSVTGGGGSLFSAFGLGFSSLEILVAGFNFDKNVYHPDTINGASNIFTLSLNGAGVSDSVSSVQGISVANGTAYEADGNLKLTAVPLPAAVWMLGSVLPMLLLARRKTV